HVPLPTSMELLGELAELGSELVALHLLKSPKLGRPLATFAGRDHPEVEKVSYTNETVWLDKSQTCSFRGVPEDVWEFCIGGYQICEKWLKDRKGRTLSKADIEQYQKIIVALHETLRIMV